MTRYWRPSPPKRTLGSVQRPSWRDGVQENSPKDERPVPERSQKGPPDPDPTDRRHNHLLVDSFIRDIKKLANDQLNRFKAFPNPSSAPASLFTVRRKLFSRNEN